MAGTDAGGIVLSLKIESASSHKVALVEDTLYERFVQTLPKKLSGNQAYDSDTLHEELHAEGVEPIAPHRGRKRKSFQDGRTPRRYKRRRKVERLSTRLQNYQRCLVRHEYKEEIFRAVLLTACIMIY